MEFESINLKEKLAKFSEHWSPKVIAQNEFTMKGDDWI